MRLEYYQSNIGIKNISSITPNTVASLKDKGLSPIFSRRKDPKRRPVRWLRQRREGRYFPHSPERRQVFHSYHTTNKCLCHPFFHNKVYFKKANFQNDK